LAQVSRARLLQLSCGTGKPRQPRHAPGAGAQPVVAYSVPSQSEAPALGTHAHTRWALASATASAPSLPGSSLCRHASAIRTGCANKRSSGSVRGVLGDWHPYRDPTTGSMSDSSVNTETINEARVAIRLVNPDGDVIWTST